jgi:gluconokinase
MISMGEYVLAVDIGTSSVRAIIYDRNGKVHHQIKETYPVIIPQKGWQEQDPNLIYDRTIRAIKAAFRGGTLKIAGIGFSSQMYSIFPIAKDGTPLLNSIIWADSRSFSQADRLLNLYGGKYFYNKTGCPVNSIYPLSKILWIKENKPEIFQTAFKFISIKEYIIHKLIGKYVVDYSYASATGFFNIFNLCWDQEILALVEIPAEKLATPVETTTKFVITEKSLTEAGIVAPLIIGAGDGPLANLGSGAAAVGEVNIDLGTSGAARIIAKEPLVDSDASLWCYALANDKWTYGGILNNVGNLYQWFADQLLFYGQNDNRAAKFAQLNHLAEKGKPGANDLYFLPFLLNARSPYWDNKLKGTIYGLSPEHNVVDIITAMVEGIAYNLLSIILVIEKSMAIKKVIFTGGLAKSAFWAQTIADVLGKTIYLPSINEGSAGGAAILSFYALGMINSLSFISDDRQCQVLPNDQSHQEHQIKYAKYQRLCSYLRELPDEIRI